MGRGPQTRHSPPLNAALRLFSSFLTEPYCPRFKTANDEEGKKESGFSPLFMAALSGNVEVARGLVTEHKVEVQTGLRDANTVLGLEAGCTPIHACMAFDRRGDVLSLLLNSGSDLNAQSKSGL